METLRQAIASTTKNLLYLNNLESNISDRAIVIREAMSFLSEFGLFVYKGYTNDEVIITEAIANAIGRYYGISEIRLIPKN